MKQPVGIVSQRERQVIYHSQRRVHATSSTLPLVILLSSLPVSFINNVDCPSLVSGVFCQQGQRWAVLYCSNEGDVDFTLQRLTN